MRQENPPSLESDFVTLASSRTGDPHLRLLHYNDVYHVEYNSLQAAFTLFDANCHNCRSGSAEPVGGVSRFQSVVQDYRSNPRYQGQSSLITFFSGDAFNPSLESSVTKGRHMVPFLNAIGTDLACVGVSMASRSNISSSSCGLSWSES